MNQDEASSTIADAHVVEQGLPQDVGFTRAESQKLAFLRWLYRTGRLTEWSVDEPGR